MLTLSRREGERILIGDDIEIVVASIVGGAVKLAIRAPRCVQIRREELLGSVESWGTSGPKPDECCTLR